jgi:transcriptional regulator with XRE-family HTH domain
MSFQMKLYSNIRELLKDYREQLGVNQDYIADKLRISERTFRRWESDKKPITLDNEHAITENLHIPFIVIRALNADIPVLYNIKSRRYSLSQVSRELFVKDLFKSVTLNQIGERIKIIEKDKEITNILNYDQGVYNTDKPIPKFLIKYASEILPELNFYVKDNFGYYSGHLVIFPIRESTYIQLKEGLISEGELKKNDLIKPEINTKVSLHVSSIYCDCLDTCIVLLKKALCNFSSLRQTRLHPDSTISGYVVTIDGSELANKFGLTKIFEKYEEKLKFQTEFTPTFFESRIEKLKYNLN